MIKEPLLYKGLCEACKKHSRIRIYSDNADAFNAVVEKVAAEDIEVTIDDVNYESDFAENHDRLFVRYEHMVGFEFL